MGVAMRIVLHILGKELLAVDVAWPASGTVPAACEGQTIPAAEQGYTTVQPELDGFGFYGGSGGQAERAWHPHTGRPIDAGLPPVSNHKNDQGMCRSARSARNDVLGDF